MFKKTSSVFIFVSEQQLRFILLHEAHTTSAIILLCTKVVLGRFGHGYQRCKCIKKTIQKANQTNMLFRTEVFHIAIEKKAKKLTLIRPVSKHSFLQPEVKTLWTFFLSSLTKIQRVPGRQPSSILRAQVNFSVITKWRECEMFLLFCISVLKIKEQWTHHTLETNAFHKTFEDRDVYIIYC